ncbi:MAG TPA: porin family protein [Gemmatirosa sp.]|nr:porin family protein [Gemmatirosa sp.]
MFAGWSSATLVGGDTQGAAERRNGLVLGGYLRIPVGAGGWALRPELLYAQKGASQTIDASDDLFGERLEATLKLDYVELPLLVEFAPRTAGGVHPFFHAGPSLGYQADCRVQARVGRESFSSGCDGADLEGPPLRSFDLGMVLGAGVRFALGAQAATVSARFQPSLTRLASEANLRNQMIAVVGSIEFALLGRR